MTNQQNRNPQQGPGQQSNPNPNPNPKPQPGSNPPPGRHDAPQDEKQLGRSDNPKNPGKSRGPGSQEAGE